MPKLKTLRKDEGKKFDIFWQAVQKAAQKMNCAFFGDNAEDKFFETDEMEGANFFGWLIPEQMAAEFVPFFLERIPDENWDKFMCFCEWDMFDGELAIRFEDEFGSKFSPPI